MPRFRTPLPAPLFLPLAFAVIPSRFRKMTLLFESTAGFSRAVSRQFQAAAVARSTLRDTSSATAGLRAISSSPLSAFHLIRPSRPTARVTPETMELLATDEAEVYVARARARRADGVRRHENRRRG